jgi:hypothetical protein
MTSRHCAGIEVGAGRVVAAGVQDDDRSCRQRVQPRLHRREIDATRRRIIIGVRVDAETGELEQCAMILPARVADVDRCLGQQPTQVIGTDLEGAGAAERLDGQDAAFGEQRRLLTEEQFLHRLVVGGQTVDRLVAARRHRLQTRLLGELDRRQQRHLAAVVEIDADAQIDLRRAAVGIERLGQAEDGIPWSHLHGSKDRSGHGLFFLKG